MRRLSDRLISYSYRLLHRWISTFHDTCLFSGIKTESFRKDVVITEGVFASCATT